MSIFFLVYDVNAEDGPLVSVHAVSNTLSLVLRDDGVMKFIKYISAGAPSSRWDVSAEFKVDLDDDNEDEKE